MVVSRNRLSAIKTCSQDDIFYNLSDYADFEPGEEDPSDRCKSGEILDKYENYRKVAILDDGFTALKAKRDLNIVLIDRSTNILWQDVIPAGILREPLSSLKDADAVVITKSVMEKESLLENRIRLINEKCKIFYSRYIPTNLLSVDGRPVDFKGLSFIAISAIGNPGYFYDNLKQMGVEIGGTMEFEDHHEYNKEDILSLGKSLKSDKWFAVTTQKDFVKLKTISDDPRFKDTLKRIFYLDFEVEINKKFYDFIYEEYRKYLKKSNPNAYIDIIEKGKK